MSLFIASDVRAVADLVRRCYDSDTVMEMYATLEADFQELLHDSQLEEEVVKTLVYKIHNESLINRALDDQEFLAKFVSMNDRVNAFHKKFESSIWRLNFCVKNYKTGDVALILNNLGKAAVLLNMKTPFAF